MDRIDWIQAIEAVPIRSSGLLRILHKFKTDDEYWPDDDEMRLLLSYDNIEVLLNAYINELKGLIAGQ